MDIKWSNHFASQIIVKIFTKRSQVELKLTVHAPSEVHLNHLAMCQIAVNWGTILWKHLCIFFKTFNDVIVIWCLLRNLTKDKLVSINIIITLRLPHNINDYTEHYNARWVQLSRCAQKTSMNGSNLGLHMFICLTWISISNSFWYLSNDIFQVSAWRIVKPTRIFLWYRFKVQDALVTLQYSDVTMSTRASQITDNSLMFWLT